MKYLILVITLLIPNTFVFAQITNNSLSLASSGIRIDLETDHIKPYTDTTLFLNDFSLPDKTLNIFWQIDGVNAPDFTNQRTITLKTKDINTPTTVEVFVETQAKKTLNAKIVLRPVYLDIILEPQTRTPVFYKGKALPSINSTVNVTAFINGDIKNTSEYVYNWRLNGENVERGSVLGKYKTSIITPIGANNILDLAVTTRNGQLIAQKAIEIPSIKSKLLFYEVNTLYGISKIPVKSHLNLIGNSTSIKAEPYYLDINTYNKPEFIEWKIDGNRSATAGNPYEVTLSKQNLASGNSTINFHVRTRTIPFQGVESNFQVKY